jgi:hypothetical protein
MKHITFIQILKPVWNVVGKIQTGEGRGTLLSYRPCTVDESEANTTGKLNTRSESRKRAFDHHDTLDT